MRRIFFAVIFSLSLTLTGLAQDASVSQATNLAQQLAGVNEFSQNLRLRFQVLFAEMDQFSGKSNPNDLLRFFSDTRVMVWNRPVSPGVEQTMRQLEQQMVGLAAKRGINLDLPPVGYAPLSQSRLISPERVTAPGLSALTLQTEQVATELLQSANSADLLFLRDNLTRLREDLADGSVATNSVRSVLGARARYLAGDAATTADARLMQRLDQLSEALRGNVSVQTLRQNQGGVVTL
jgi:hypothetical protein